VWQIGLVGELESKEVCSTSGSDNKVNRRWSNQMQQANEKISHEKTCPNQQKLNKKVLIIFC